jgi:hypothetical protein
MRIAFAAISTQKETEQSLNIPLFFCDIKLFSLVGVASNSGPIFFNEI